MGGTGGWYRVDSGQPLPNTTRVGGDEFLLLVAAWRFGIVVILVGLFELLAVVHLIGRSSH